MHSYRTAKGDNQTSTTVRGGQPMSLTILHILFCVLSVPTWFPLLTLRHYTLVFTLHVPASDHPVTTDHAVLVNSFSIFVFSRRMDIYFSLKYCIPLKSYMFLLLFCVNAWKQEFIDHMITNTNTVVSKQHKVLLYLYFIKSRTFSQLLCEPQRGDVDICARS